MVATTKGTAAAGILSPGRARSPTGSRTTVARDTEDQRKQSRSSARWRVNWDMLEKRIAESETAYQRPVIRRKIDELVTYYKECKDAGTLPAIPGAVIITSEKRFTFTPVAGHHDLGLLQI